MNAAGKVGIGTTNPTYQLHVASKKGTQFATSGDNDGSLGDSTGIVVNAKGNVGIGLTNPIESLETPNNIKVDKSVIYSIAPANTSYTGDVISMIAYTNMALGDIVYTYLDGSTMKAALCKADAIANCPFALAMCVETITAGNTGKFITRGTVRNDSWSDLTVGGSRSIVYVSITGTTGNTFSQTAPSFSNNVIMPVGVAIGTKTIYFTGNINTVEKL